MPKRTKPESTNPKPVAAVEDEDADGDDCLNVGLNPNSTEDICKNVLDRYGNSSAPQHRHLCASACAVRSILTEEGFSLTPAAYMAAVLNAIRHANRADRDGIVALSSFLSILLPLVPIGSVPPTMAREASMAVVELLQTPPECVANTTVRSLVMCLGILTLCLDLDDWRVVQEPLEVLFRFSMDRRPKVRKCAQISIEKAFAALSSSKAIKKAGRLQLSMFRNHISLEYSEESRKKRSPKLKNTEALHLLNIVVQIVPKLPKKIIVKFLPEACNLLGCQFSLFTRHIIALFDVLLEHLDSDELISEADRITSVLSNYMSLTKRNPADTILSASDLLKKVLKKLYPTLPGLWMAKIPLIFRILADFLDSKTVTAKRAADILVELISFHIDHNIFPVDVVMTCSDDALTSESRALVSICSTLENILGASGGVPNEHILEVLKQLFVKLGDKSYIFMQNIIKKFSKWELQMEDPAFRNHLQECIGHAVIAMGPEKILSLLPVSFNEVDFTCSNTWLIPILRKYISGASLKFFVDHIAPVIKSIKATCKKVKESKIRKDLQPYVLNLWSLLPAFCHYPIDTSQNFDFFAQFLLSKFKEDPSTHETIVASLKVLVDENRNLLRESQDVKSTNVIVNGATAETKSINYASSRLCYTKRVSSKNIKAKSSCFVNFLAAIVDVFFSSPPEKRLYLKEGIECLLSIIGALDVQKFLLLFVEEIEYVGNVSASEDPVSPQLSATSENVGKTNEKKKDEEKRCLALELISCFIVGLNKDLVHKIYNCIRHFLLMEDGKVCHESYLTLSRILKEHCWFSLEKADELIDLVIKVKLPSDIAISKNRFSCLHFLLLHLLKSEEEGAKKKIFIILNETILTLKDSDKEIRKIAYDMLLALACSCRDPQSTDSLSQLRELLTMIMGYLSGSSPQITSGAVAALSLLVYKDANLFLSVPDLLPSVLSLLKRKQVEVIKAALGFIKVVVSSLNVDELSSLLPGIANGTLPWSLVSKNHFRAKVRLIFEIIIRKCGSDLVNMVVPDKYRSFIRNVEEHRWKRSSQEVDGKPDTNYPEDSSHKGLKKRKHDICSSSGNKHLRTSGKPRKGNDRKKDNLSCNDRRRNAREGVGRRRHINNGNYSISKVSSRIKYNDKKTPTYGKPNRSVLK